MNRSNILMIACCCAISFLSSCKKDATPAEEIITLTPYVLQIPAGLPPMQIPESNPMTVEGVALGKQLFFDPILSGDNTMACAACHRQNFAFVDSTLRFSIGIDKLPGTRNAMPLMNLGYQKQFFWDGGAADLESQVIGPIQNPVEMHETLSNAIMELNSHPYYPSKFKRIFGGDKITTAMVMKVIAQFERTLISGNSKYDQMKAGKASFTAAEQNGMNLFTDMKEGDCAHCHVIGSTFSDFEYRNTGLDSMPVDIGRGRITLNPTDDGKFKTPSMRNIALTAPYMHDGRFNTLEECIQHYNTGFKMTDNLDPNLVNTKKGRLNTQEIQDIIAFLNTLTDTEFTTNPAFKK